MEKKQILKQIYEVTNSFDEEQFITALKSQLGSAIFKHLINEEKESVTITITFDVPVEKKPDPDTDKAEMRELLNKIWEFKQEEGKEDGNLLFLQIQARHLAAR